MRRCRILPLLEMAVNSFTQKAEAVEYPSKAMIVAISVGKLVGSQDLDRVGGT